MKKKILSLLLAVVMVVSLLPTVAFADGGLNITNGTPESAKETNHGHITIDNTTAAEGDTVTITVNPADDYQLKSLKVAPAGFVDLGITDADDPPLYWAECNLGASTAEDYGDYFAWGETAPYYTTTGGWPATPTWKSGKDSGYHWNSYCGESSFVEWSTPPYDATSNILKPEFDAATAANSSWRTPTRDEFVALATNCVLIWTSNYNDTNKSGYIVYKAKNDADKGKANIENGTWNMWDAANSKYIANTGSEPTGYSTSDIHIFLPAAGIGAGKNLNNLNTGGTYWSGTLGSNNATAYALTAMGIGIGLSGGQRQLGYSIRPVMSDPGITPAKQTDGTYQFTMPDYPVTVTAEFEVTIADILPSNFPASDVDNSWCNSGNDNIYIYKTDSNLVFYNNTEDIYYVSLSSPLTKEENPKVSYKYLQGDDWIQFNMTGDNDDELDSIIVSNCTNTSCIGTYTYEAPATKTIADILPADFPLCVDTMPSNTWVNGKGINLMLIQYTLGLITNDGENERVLAEDIRTTILTKTGDNYTYANNGVTTTFIMLNNTLFSVKVNGLTGDLVDFNGTYILSHTHDDIKFLPWDTTDSLPNEEGSYYLDTDVTLSSTWNVPAGITNLCLNGYAIKANATGTNPFSAITVGSGATLNLYDCSDKVYYFDKDSGTGLWTLAADQAAPTDYFVTGGIITGGNSTSGGAVYVNGGTFTMNGGNIVGNRSDQNGGGVYVDGTNASFTMSGSATISGNAASVGGGVYINVGGFTMTNGTIKGNTASMCGGVNIGGGTFTMTGGIISGNASNGFFMNYGGVISGGNITLGGTAQITGNEGYNLYLNSSTAITVGTDDKTPQAGMSVSLFLGTPGVFTANAADGYKDYFHAENTGYSIIYTADKKLKMALPHSVTAAPAPANGTVVADKSSNVFEGETVTVTVTPNSGYKLKSLSYTPEGESAQAITKTNGVYSFTMPDKNIIITAEFKYVGSPYSPDEPGQLNPDTGDTSNIGLGVALMLISSLGAAACLKDGKKRRNTQ